MDLINNNPFRIIGILSNASQRDLQRQKSKITAFARVGQEIKSDLDFQILDSITRTEDSIAKAFANIQQPKDKVNHSLFWFLNTSPFDNTAIEYLKNGDGEKAIEIWEKVTNDKEVNSKNYSAFSNLGTYKLLSKDKLDIKLGIEAKLKLIESEFFESFVHAVADLTHIIDNKKQIEKMIDELLMQFKNQYSSSETLQLFSNCNDSTQKYLSKKFTEEPLHRVESQIESCKKKRNANKSVAYTAGLSLFTNTKNDLSLLKSLLGASDLEYRAVADQLANEIMQCGIDYFNESQDNNSSDNYLESSQKLTRLADSIAVGKLTKDRAKDSLATLEEMKDREINEAISILSSVKLSYENAISEIDAQVSEMVRKMPYNQTINYSKVEQMKATCINWDKVIELIEKVIPQKNIAKIKNTSNIIKTKEYKDLVEFIFRKLNYSQKSRVKYICYWESKIPPSPQPPGPGPGIEIPQWLYWVAGIMLLIILVNTCD